MEGRPTDDSVLIARAQRGDAAAYEEIVQRHQLELRLTEGFRPGDAAPSPEAVAVAADERRRLLAIVNALSHEDRLVIASRYFLELSGEETAAALGIAEGTVKSRLSRALARLKARVEEAAHA